LLLQVCRERLSSAAKERERGGGGRGRRRGRERERDLRLDLDLVLIPFVTMDILCRGILSVLFCPNLPLCERNGRGYQIEREIDR